MSHFKPLRVAVVGAGWAGLSAAYRLSMANMRVTVFEAAREAGGRARSFDWPASPSGGQRLDNGQHILIGAYRETLELIHLLSGDLSQCLRREPLTLCDVDGLMLRARPVPAPLHLLLAIALARGLTWPQRLSMAWLMQRAKRAHWRLPVDMSVKQWLTEQAQPEALIERIWAPLCVAALNTPVHQASAQVFLNVLRDSLGAARAASDLLLPLGTLDRSLPQPALDALKRRGTEIRLGCAVTGIDLTEHHVSLAIRERSEPFDGVVLAVPGHQVASLLSHAQGPRWDALRRQCQALTWQPITTCYLVFDQAVQLGAPMMALREHPSHGAFGQWVFARGQLGGRADTLAVVISAAGPHLELSHKALGEAIESQLRQQLNLTAKVLGMRVVTEKRATFASLPNLSRPDCETPHERLVLAGDYTQSDYPATLEGAVASGHRAARLLLEQARVTPS